MSTMVSSRHLSPIPRSRENRVDSAGFIAKFAAHIAEVQLVIRGTLDSEGEEFGDETSMSFDGASLCHASARLPIFYERSFKWR